MNDNTQSPELEREALRQIFLDAMSWGRSYGQRLNLSDITLNDVALGYVDLANAARTPLMEENERLKQELQGLADRSIYKGNSVSHIYQKAECYGAIVLELHKILSPFKTEPPGESVDVRELAKRAALKGNQS